MSLQNAKRNADSTHPIVQGRAVTPSDTVLFAEGICRGLWVGTSGNVSVIEADGTVTTYIGVPGGGIFPVQCVGVRATLTTATNIVALR